MLKKIFLVATLCTLCISISTAQKIYKQFVSKTSENGMIYFIKPREMPKAGKNNTVADPMEFDLTIITNKDSVAFYVTIYTKEPIVLENAIIQSDNKIVVSETLEKIYVDMHKNAYKGRYKFFVDKKQLNAIYSNQNPYVVDFGNGIKFATPKSKWQKEQEIYNTVANLSKMNSN